MKYNKPKLKFWTLGFLVLMLSLSTRAKIHLSEDGGYSNIVIRISDQLDMNKCSDIIAGLKVRDKIQCQFYSVRVDVVVQDSCFGFEFEMFYGVFSFGKCQNFG